MGRPIDFWGYCRRVDALEYQLRRHDVPHDIDELLELNRDIEREDAIIVDREDNDE